jgi:dihydroorotate dehydrogenase
MAFFSLLKPLLFALPPETAHHLVLGALSRVGRLPGFGALQRALRPADPPALRVRLWGCEFPNPLGLAAGFDKDGRALAALLGLGFGFVEAGTVTPRPQPGNPRPRLFRLTEDGALVNRMGFNNDGAAALAQRVRALRAGGVGGLVGINLGKNRDTPLERATEDYLAALAAVYEVADYLVVNVSSPNTPGLRGLQTRAALVAMAGALSAERARRVAAGQRHVPLLIKVAPDLDEPALADVVEAALETDCDGLIAANTTTAREGLRSPRRDEAGGLSGLPLHPRALATVTTLHRLCGGRLPLVGVGGIAGAEQAYAFIRAGATLVQLYTGLVYRGPGLVGEIKLGLARLLRRDGFATLAEAVGSGPSLEAQGSTP